MTTAGISPLATDTRPSRSGADASAATLRILWVKVGGLWPVNTGGRLRSFHLIEALSHRHELSVITTHHPQEDADALARQLPHARQVISVPHSSAKRNSVRFLWALLRSWLTPLPVDLFKSRVAKLGREVERALAGGDFDLCIADFLFAVPNVPLRGKTPVLFFAHNVEYRIWQRLGSTGAGPVRRAILALEWRKMRRYETETCRRADLTVAVSEEDRQLLGQGASGSRIQAISTGVDIDYFRAGEGAREQAAEIVFTGSMDWHPNEDAMLYFIDAILPLVRRDMPQASLTVAGRNPGEKLHLAAAAADVRVTGTVADVRPFIERAAVYIVPLRIGGGTRLKIYEALAMGKAVVSTTIGAEGLPLEEGVHIVRADDPEAFAGQVVALLRDSARRRALGRAGRSLMEQQYSWPRVAREFERHCRAALE